MQRHHETQLGKAKIGTTFVVVLATLAMSCALWAATVWLIRTDRANAIADDLQNNNNLAQLHEQRVSSSLQMLDQVLLSLRHDYATHKTTDVVKDHLALMRFGLEHVGIVSVLGPLGEVLSTNAPSLAGNYADRDYFKFHQNTPADELLIGKPIRGRVTGKWLISLSRRIYLPNGGFGGVIFMALDPAFFASDYEKTHIGPHSAMALIGLDGITRVRRNNGKISFGEDIRNSQLFKELPKAADGSYVAEAASDGTLRAVSYRSVQGFPLVVIVASSVTDILNTLKDRMYYYIALCVLGMTMLIGLSALFLSMLRSHRNHVQSLEKIGMRFRSIIDASPVPMALNSREGVINYLNPAFTQSYGYTIDDLPDLPSWWSKAYPDAAYRESIVAAWGKELLRMESDRSSFSPLEVRVRCKDGSDKTTLASAAQFFNPDHGEHLVVLFDITEQQTTTQALETALAEKTSLLNEVHHRVKNNLQVISSLLRLESGRTELSQTRAVLTDMQGRIRSMSLLHESLYRSGVFAQIDLAAYLRRLATESFRAQSNSSTKLHLQLDLEKLNVSLDLATPCALLVNELISNSIKHGFADGRAGTLSISLQQDSITGETLDPLWILVVSDDGVGLPADFEDRRTRSLGMQLVTDLCSQMRGSLSIGPGARFEVRFPPMHSALGRSDP